jgi:hypothetical protein
MPCYNAPAQVNTKGIGMYSSASFIYWQPMQDDMEITNVNLPESGRKVVTFDFKYKPGFKICLGGNLEYDNWDISAEYTRYHTGNMVTSIATTGFFSITPPFFNGPVLTTIISGETANNSIFVGNNASKLWNFKFDAIDGMLARSFKVGMQLNLRPSLGIRAAWIRQRLEESFSSNQPFFSSFTFPDNDVSFTNPAIFTTNKILSWGVGFKGALEANWLLGCGFKLFGFGAFDLLYTRYNLSNDTTLLSGVNVIQIPSFEDPLYAIRSHNELELGLSYADYFNNGKCYVDVSAGYGFQVFWNQNMFLENTASPLPNNQLSLQGLRLTLLFAY